MYISTQRANLVNTESTRLQLIESVKSVKFCYVYDLTRCDNI